MGAQTRQQRLAMHASVASDRFAQLSESTCQVHTSSHRVEHGSQHIGTGVSWGILQDSKQCIDLRALVSISISCHLFRPSEPHGFCCSQHAGLPCGMHKNTHVHPCWAGSAGSAQLLETDPSEVEGDCLWWLHICIGPEACFCSCVGHCNERAVVVFEYNMPVDGIMSGYTASLLAENPSLFFPTKNRSCSMKATLCTAKL